MAKQVMLGVRLDAETRSAFKAWCAARQVTAQAVLRDDVARHLSTLRSRPSRAIEPWCSCRGLGPSACGGG